MRKILLKSALSLLTMFICVVSIGQTPTINSFSPSSGPVGTLVTISGSNLSSPTNFTIGGVAAIVVSNDGTQLVGMVMPGATNGIVSIITSGGTANSASSFTITATQYPSHQQGSKLVGSGNLGASQHGSAVSVSADGNTAIVGGLSDNNNQGAAWIYTRAGGVWSQQGTKLVGTGGIGSSVFQGCSVAISADGTTAMVGGYGDDNNQGATWVFKRNAGVWSQQGTKLVGTGSVGAAYQGYSVSLSADGNTAIVGGQCDNSFQGAAWIYKRAGDVWSQQGTKLVGTGNIGAAYQGVKVSISADGNTAIVGGYCDNNYLGAAWVYTQNAGIWSQQGTKLVGTGNVGTSYQGSAVSISADGNTAIIGGQGDNNELGAAWIFKRTGAVWSQQGNKLVGTGAVLIPPFRVYQGYSVSISADGNTALVGGGFDNMNMGAVWVYTQNAGIWSQQGNKIIGDGAVGLATYQGTSVSLSADGNTAIVGGGGDNSGIGATWVFTTSPTQVPTISNFSSTNGPIGTLVTITGSNLSNPTNIIIGGVAAIPISNDGSTLVAMVMPGATTGAVSVTTAGGTAIGSINFTVSASKLPNTQQGNKLVGSGAAGGSSQGYSVALSADGNTAIVGGYTDNAFVGAAWIYIRNGSMWTQQGNKLVGSGNIGISKQGVSVALSADGNTAIVGGFQDDNFTGAAWVFIRSVGNWTQQGNKLVGTGAVGPGTQGANQGVSVSLSADGNTAIVGGDHDINSSGTGAVWIYKRSNGIWAQQGDKLIGSGAVGNSWQGNSVALSADGNTAIVGGYGDNGNTGAAWVYSLNGGLWIQQGNKLVGTGSIGSAQQGCATALSADGNTAIIGAYGDDSNAGAVWIFTRNNNTWTQEGNKIIGTGLAGTSEQGRTVSLSADGNTAIVGGFIDNSNVGAAWLYVRSNGVWSQNVNNFAGSGANGNPEQIWYVSLSADGNTALVGIDQDIPYGAAWVYTSQPAPTITNFSPASGPIGTLISINGTNLSNQSSLTIGGVPAIQISNDGTNIVAMVMPGATTGGLSVTTAGGIASGSTDFTITPSVNINTQQGNKLVANDEVGAGFHGQAVAISADGNTAVVGGFQDGLISEGQKGAVWIYSRSGSVWSQQGNKLIGTDGGNFGQEGRSVAISADGNTVLVGAPSDNGGRGAAFVFIRTGNTWTQQGLKLIGTGVSGPIGVQQGWSVALSADGNTAVIGGIRDNGAIGAIWVFTRTNNTWTQQGDKLVGTGNIGSSYQGQSVAISADGNTIIDGAQGDNNTQGAAWVFAKSGNSWLQQGDKLVGIGNTATSQQGYSVAISADGNTALIGGGGSEGNQIGAIWVFTRTNGSWTQQGDKLQGSGNTGSSFQGTSVSLSADGNQALIGGLNDDNGKGAMWLFTRTGNAWSQQGDKMIGSNSSADARQGISVSLSADGTTGIIGGDLDNSGTGAAWIFVPSSSVSGGGVSGGSSGGLESKSLGDAVVKRVYTKAQSNQNGPDDYTKLPLINNTGIRNQATGIGTAIKLSSIMPDISAKGYTAFNSTPMDIVSITNAKEVMAMDFTINQQCKAVAFATKTTGELYDHTKPICDRLKGASLIKVENLKVGGYDFVKYTLNNAKGQREYATSFSIGTKTGRSDLSLQSTWLMKDYIIDETMYNFQLWASSPDLVNAMISDVITKLKLVAPIKSISKNGVPATYILSGKREGQNLNLAVSNNSGSTTGYFLLEDKSNESNIAISKRQIPFTINTNGVTNVSIPMSDLYESNITMYVNGEMKDVVYMSDGTWYADYNKSTTTITNFNISNDAKRTISSDEFPLMRNVTVQGNSQDYVSIIKLLKGGAAETDLSSYKGLKITASGGYNLHVTLIKNSTINWKDQYHSDIKLDQNQKDYYIALDKFVSDATKDKIKANDITTVVFSIDLPGGGTTYPINSNFSNISFTKVDFDYIASLESKEVQVYPNPTVGGKFICSFKSDKDAELTLHVNDITGRQIYSQKVSAIKGENKVPVTLTNSINGMHIISLEGANVKYDSKKLSVRY